jgi:hypothetical protein
MYEFQHNIQIFKSICYILTISHIIFFLFDDIESIFLSLSLCVCVCVCGICVCYFVIFLFFVYLYFSIFDIYTMIFIFIFIFMLYTNRLHCSRIDPCTQMCLENIKILLDYRIIIIIIIMHKFDFTNDFFHP